MPWRSRSRSGTARSAWPASPTTKPRRRWSPSSWPTSKAWTAWATRWPSAPCW